MKRTSSRHENKAYVKRIHVSHRHELSFRVVCGIIHYFNSYFK